MNCLQASEIVHFERLLTIGPDGKARPWRINGEPILGVCLADAMPGEQVRYSTDLDLILLALQIDAADRV